MNKRKKELSGDNELNISKAKRSLRENSQLTAETNFEIPVPQSHDSEQKSKPTTAVTKQEWEEKSQENSEALAGNLQTSSNDEGIKNSPELKQLSLPLSQNSSGKFVPVFAKPKKGLTETPQRKNGEAAEFQTEQTLMMHKLQETLESNLRCTDNSLACEPSEVDMQEAKSPPGSSQLMGTKVQEAEDTVIPHCQKCTSEGLDVKTQNQHKINNISNEAAMVGVSHQGTASNLKEDSCDQNTYVELVPLFPDTLCQKDAGSHENRNLSLGSLECPIQKDESYSILAEHRIFEGGKDRQNEDVNSSLQNVDQKKLTEEDETAIKLSNVKEEKGTKSMHGEGVALVDTSIKSKMESRIIKPQFLVNLNITTDEEQNNNTCTSGRAEEQSSSDKGAEQRNPFKDAKAAEQNSPHGSGKIAEHSDLCSVDKIVGESYSKSSGKATLQSSPCTGDEVVVEQGGSCKVTEQSSPNSSGAFLEQKSENGDGKVVKQRSPHSSGNVSEKTGNDRDREISGKDFPSSSQSIIVDLKMDVEVTESKSVQTTETISLFCLQTERCGPLECSSASQQPAFYTGEPDAGKEEAEKERERSVGTRAESSPVALDSLIDSCFIHENNQEDHIPLEWWKANGSEGLRPDRKQSPVSICDSGPNILEVKQSNTDSVPQAATQIPETGIKSSPLSLGLLWNVKNNEETVICEKHKMDPVPMENCLSPLDLNITTDEEQNMCTSRCVDVLEQLKREKVISHKRGTDANSGGWPSLSAADISLPTGALSDPLPVDQTCSSWEDALSLDLELLPDSQFQSVLEDNRVELSQQQPFSVGSNCSPSIPEREHRDPQMPVPVINISYPNKLQTRVEMMEESCDSTKEQDATDVVCGLIIELSNLNRLIMNTHRDLESFKRLKYRKSRQSGKFFAHALKGATNTVYTVKKWKEV
ncbi:break repair meiotic recombinase recruitment factor 1 isoform X2 [Pelodiscus sinensis]